MKKTISVILILAIFFSLSAPSLAHDSSKALNTGEPVLTYKDETCTIEVFAETTPDGTVLLSEYHDGVLFEQVRYRDGSTFFERRFYTSSESNLAAEINGEWESVNALPSAEAAMPLSANGRVVRDLGYMHYYNGFLDDTYTISCYVEEWFNPQKIITISGARGTISEFTANVALSLTLSSKISSDFVAAIIGAGVASVISGIVHFFTDVEVRANVIDQRIFGNCTSHSGKPTGDLGNASIAYVTSTDSRYAGDTFYDGYTTHMWETDDLGCMMFYKVFGVAYNPTSWSSALV